jgi:ABC-type multidrug transport system fused ATPase/permease subunit
MLRIRGLVIVVGMSTAAPVRTHSPLPVPAPFESAPPSVAKIEAAGLNVYYGHRRVLENVHIAIRSYEVTALIGPSGCFKSTFLRALNRMNDIVPGARAEGRVVIDRKDIYASSVDLSTCGGGSGWCSRNRTRSPSRSSTTSPTGCGSTI